MTKPALSSAALSQLFTQARSFHRWTNEPVPESALHELYELFKWGPTSVNANPGRVVFVRSEEAKRRLYPALLESNVAQVQNAPVTAIVCYDEAFTSKLPALFPHFDVKALFDADAKLTFDTAFRNSSLQGAYLILAARALGLDVCPMSGFDNAKVDAEFLQGTQWRSNLLCVLGHGDTSGLFPRGPRINFDEACQIV